MGGKPPLDQYHHPHHPGPPPPSKQRHESRKTPKEVGGCGKVSWWGHQQLDRHNRLARYHQASPLPHKDPWTNGPEPCAMYGNTCCEAIQSHQYPEMMQVLCNHSDAGSGVAENAES